MSLDVYLYLDDPFGGRSLSYTTNITHNLGKMAEAAHLYKYLWHPETNGITCARDLIKPLLRGYCHLITRKDEMEKLNAPNGWGTYENFLPFVSDYLEQCTLNPEARVEVSR